MNDISQNDIKLNKNIKHFSNISVGRRKRAIARVKLSVSLNNKNNKFTINNRDFRDYFSSEIHKKVIQYPLDTLNITLDEYNISILVKGGGLAGQADAIALGIARTLDSYNRKKNRKILKKAGLLIRDSRIKERKKAGLKKARKAPQYSKR